MRTYLLAGAVALFVSGCGPGGLERLVLDGEELHTSLETLDLGDVERLHVPRTVLRSNPQLSTDPDFVRSITGGGSQGRLRDEPVRSALYALYQGENELGFYGLETETVEDADRLEPVLREIWARNASLDRARVHRDGRTLLVVWTDGVSAESWQSVNAVVTERLSGS